MPVWLMPSHRLCAWPQRALRTSGRISGFIRIGRCASWTTVRPNPDLEFYRNQSGQVRTEPRFFADNIRSAAKRENRRTKSSKLTCQSDPLPDDGHRKVPSFRKIICRPLVFDSHLLRLPRAGFLRSFQHFTLVKIYPQPFTGERE